MKKPILIDLRIGRKRITSLDELRKHFIINITDIIDAFHSGLLVKWLRDQHMILEQEAVDKIKPNDNADAIKELSQILKKLSQIFKIEIDDEIIETTITKSVGTLGIRSHKFYSYRQYELRMKIHKFLMNFVDEDDTDEIRQKVEDILLSEYNIKDLQMEVDEMRKTEEISKQDRLHTAINRIWIVANFVSISKEKRSQRNAGNIK